MNITLPKLYNAFSFQERQRLSIVADAQIFMILGADTPSIPDFSALPYIQAGFKTQYLKGSVEALNEMVSALPASGKQQLPISGIICELGYFTQCQAEILQLVQTNVVVKYLPFIVVGTTMNDPQQIKQTSQYLKQLGVVDDFYVQPFEPTDLLQRLLYLQRFKLVKPELHITPDVVSNYSMPLGKRIFDIMFALGALIVLSPLLALIAIAIKLESKGPVLYKSKRAGTGYKVFDFYKFRSMTTNADSQLTQLQHLNQYNDGNDTQPAPSFVKINNDPRITTVGKFIRNTSLDELPQLFNVLIGDMSVVGNRPLPLYEAKQLTRDEWAMRFLAPAGITGLWQVSKRGKAEMSALERIQLDNEYAQKANFWFDLKIMLQTLPAMFQKETV